MNKAKAGKGIKSDQDIILGITLKDGILMEETFNQRC